jgi:ABC-type Zn uptake system ZnuABC Zn-binding protein ZnuA
MTKIFRSLALFFFCTLAYSQISVISTIPALGLMVKQIGGEHVLVTSLFKKPTDPHFFQLTPKQLALLHETDFTITAEEFASKIPLSHDKIISIIQTNQHSKRYEHALHHLMTGKCSHEEHDHHHDKHQDHEHAMVKHEWLSFNGAIALSEVIVEQLSSKEPELAEYFKAHAEEMVQELIALKKHYQQLPLKKQNIFYHESFKILAQELHQNC